MLSAARRKSSRPCFSPSQSNSMATERIMAVGLATPRPAISGAAPWAAWAMARSRPALIDGPSPRPPDSSAVRSDRMSPNMLVVTITSNASGWRTKRAAMASTRYSSTSSPPCCPATENAVSRNNPSVRLRTFALCTTASLRLRDAAMRQASSATRREPSRVILRTASATSSVGMNSPDPRAIERSA